jgi:hypothetical protein
MSDNEGIPSRYVHGLLCEDIRDEASGSQNLIGVFADRMQVLGDFPIIFPKFAALAWVSCPLSDEIPEIQLFLEVPGGDTIVVPAEIPPAFPPPVAGDVKKSLKCVFRAINLTVPMPGRVRLRLGVWGKMWTAAVVEVSPPQQA